MNSSYSLLTVPCLLGIESGPLRGYRYINRFACCTRNGKSLLLSEWFGTKEAPIVKMPIFRPLPIDH